MIALLLLACTGHIEPAPEAPASKTPPPPIGDPFASTVLEPVEREAIYVVEPMPGGKQLQAGYLLFPDGETWIVSYRPDPALYPYVDKRVVVKGTPNRPSPLVQHVGATHITVDEMRLADGEAPWDPLPTELPAPALVRDLPALEARVGRWAEVVGEPVSLGPEAEHRHLGVYRVDGGEVQVMVPVAKAEAFRARVGQPSTLLARVSREEGALRLGFGAICAGEAPRCGVIEAR